MFVLPSKFYNKHLLYFAYFVCTFLYKYQISHERIVNRDLMILDSTSRWWLAESSKILIEAYEFISVNVLPVQ